MADESGNSERLEEEKNGDVEVEIVGDTKKVYVYSPVFTKEDEELYRFVSSQLGDAPENDDSSSSISSTDSLEGTSSAHKASPGKSAEIQSTSNDQPDELRDSLDSTWADPPRLEDVGSAVPPLDIRGVETPVKPRKTENSHRKKDRHKVKETVSAKPEDEKTDVPTSEAPSNPAFFQSGSGIPPSFFAPGAYPAAASGASIVYFAAPGMPGIPFPLMLPNQQVFSGAGPVVSDLGKSSDSEETVTEEQIKHKHHRNHHRRHKKKKDENFKTSEKSAGSENQSETLSSATIHDYVQSGSSSRGPYTEEDYFHYGKEKSSNPVSGLPWDGNYDDEYYEQEMSNRQFLSTGKISAKPFNEVGLPPKKFTKDGSQSPIRKLPPKPLPFRRTDVDYVETNKATYGRFTGPTYGQKLEKRQEDRAVTNMIDDERARIRMKVERAALLKKLAKLNDGKRAIAGQEYLQDEYDQYQYYESMGMDNENFMGQYPSGGNDYYDEYYYQNAEIQDSAEIGWYNNMERLVKTQQHKLAQRAADSFKSTSAPTKNLFGPHRPQPPPVQSTGPGRNNTMPENQLANQSRFRVNHEIQAVQGNFNRGPPQRNPPPQQAMRGMGPRQVQNQMMMMQNYQDQNYMGNNLSYPPFPSQQFPQSPYGMPNQNYPIHNQYPGGNVSFEQNLVGQAADWPLMSARLSQQYYDQSYQDPLNQYNLLPPINSELDLPSSPNDSTIKPRARSEYVYPKDRHLYSQRPYDDSQIPSNTGSYATNFQNQITGQNQIKNYKPYTLKDFRRLKKEMQSLARVGGLGPDLISDSVRQKQEKQMRRIKYAQFVDEVNRQAIEQAHDNNETYRINSENTPKMTEEHLRRQRLLEYARNVPKPKPRRNKPENQPQKQVGRKNVRTRNLSLNQKPGNEEPHDGFLAFQGLRSEEPHDGYLAFQSGSNPELNQDEEMRLEELRRRHEQDKQLAYNDSKQVRFGPV